MAPAPTPPPPGSMTVPPYFGWEAIGTGLVLVVLLAVVAFVLLSAGTATSGRTEWQAWLDGRSARRHDRGGVPDERPRGLSRD